VHGRVFPKILRANPWRIGLNYCSRLSHPRAQDLLAVHMQKGRRDACLGVAAVRAAGRKSDAPGRLRGMGTPFSMSPTYRPPCISSPPHPFFLCEPARGLLHYMCIYQSTIAEHRELGVTCILVARRLSFFTVSAGSVKRGDTESVESRDR
jgi:hypothetical protein